MSIRNETLRKKLELKRSALIAKIQPWQDELELTQGMLQQLDAHDAKQAQQAELKLGINEKTEEAA